MALESKSLMSQNSTESTVVVVGQTTFMLYEYVNPRAYKGGGGGVWWMPPPIRFFLNFSKTNYFLHLPFSVATVLSPLVMHVLENCFSFRLETVFKGARLSTSLFNC